MKFGSAVFALLISIAVGYYYSFLKSSDFSQSTIAHLATALKPFISPFFTDRLSPHESTSEDIMQSEIEEGVKLPEDIEVNSDPKTMIRRTLVKAFKAVEKAEGAGARVRRSIGVAQLRNFSPFLMLDHFTIGKGAGFPDHPHRGQETITYLLSGSIDHEDFAGGKGTINAGDLQFMTAGRGIVHAEMPGLGSELPGAAPIVGMQLWVDLPKELKYCEPRYRDLRAQEIPIVKSKDGKTEIKVISGKSHGVDSLYDLAYTAVWFFDVIISPGGRVTQELPKGWNAFIYTLSGTVDLWTGDGESTKIPEFHNAVLGREGDGVELSVPKGSRERARFILVAGKVLEQEVVQYGPFVVTSEEEVYQAMMDYQKNQNGFERAKGWKSEIGKRMR